MPMIFQGIVWPDAPEFIFEKPVISCKAPPSSGVFGICTTDKWLYFEPAQNIEERMMLLFDGGHPVPLLFYPLEGFTARTMDYNSAVAFAARLTSHFGAVFPPHPADVPHQ